MVCEGTVLNVGFDSDKKKSAAPSKALVERLSKRPERAAKLKSDRPAVFSDVAPAKDGSRGSVRVNPVTGKMTSVTKNANAKDMVREGSLHIPKEYLFAAAEAGLGNANGMYSHMTGLRRELSGAHNVSASASSRPTRKPTYEPKVNNLGGRIHKIETSNRKPRSNIKHVVQGRSRSVNSGPSKVKESSYTRQKGVINNLGGCSNTRSNSSQSCNNSSSSSSNNNKTGIAQLSFGSGGKSFIKHHEGPIKHPNRNSGSVAPSKPKSKASSTTIVERAPGITKRLGSSTSGGTNMSDRQKRAAYFADKFGKK